MDDNPVIIAEEEVDEQQIFDETTKIKLPDFCNEEEEEDHDEEEDEEEDDKEEEEVEEDEEDVEEAEDDDENELLQKPSVPAPKPTNIKISFNCMTKFEKVLLLGFRTQQIINGSPILIDNSKLRLKTPYDIAVEELRQHVIPFKIRRKLPDGTHEIWSIEEFCNV